MATTHLPVTENTLIAIKVVVHNSSKKLKLPLKDLGADKLLPQLRDLIQLQPGEDVVFERYSDSVGGYVVLDPANPAIFKTLVRAAKAKLKLRLRATVSPPPRSIQASGEERSRKAPKTSKVMSTGVAPVSLDAATVARFGDMMASCRGSTAFDQRSVGPGIFQFREPATATEKAETDEVNEAAVPDAFMAAGRKHAAGLSLSPSPSTEPELAFRTRDFCRPSSWSVYCNECDVAMNSTHFHCSVCDGGDYDLCQSCVDSGKLCPGEGHWLIKRTVVGGKFVSSTTELAAPKPRAQVESVESMPAQVESDKATAERDMPGTFTDDARTLNDEAEGTFRNCNNCIIGLPDHEFVTCAVCDDFDLCRRCYTDNKHGHHPAHGFAPAVPTAKLSAVEEALLTPGRNVFHNALCDGCEKNIRGIRHKCFTCPDFDYCNDCVKNARVTHPGHRFAQIYKPTAVARISFTATHHGVYCDGPLCNDKPGQSYIKGVRYKCVVCNDKDFCASCEALPGNTHNKTHPLVKFKTPVNHVTVSTQNETRDGKVSSLGDKDAAPKPTTPKPTTNVTTPVKTVADIEPSQKTMEEVRPYRTLASVLTENAALEAHFVKDDIVDGTAIESNATFTQAWTLRNPGPRAWPSGCSVRFVGGDHMLHVRPYCPAASNANEASESNVIWREVQPGEEVSFRVILKTPSREGKSISYWRVMTADGTPFGHKLWCDINVTSPLSLNATTEWYAARDDRTPLLAGYDERMAAMDRATLIRSMEEYLPKHKGTPKAPLPARASTKEEFVRRTMAAQTATSVDAPKAEASAKTDSAPAQTKTKAEARGQEEDEGETKDSQMIFPRLERESPSSSAYESFGPSATTTVKAAFVEDEESRAEVVDASLAPASSPEAASTVSSQKAKTSEEEFEDIFELEVLSADGDEASDEDGFMTDEEYDILDASDQETVASK